MHLLHRSGYLKQLHFVTLPNPQSKRPRFTSLGQTNSAAAVRGDQGSGAPHTILHRRVGRAQWAQPHGECPSTSRRSVLRPEVAVVDRGVPSAKLFLPVLLLNIPAMGTTVCHGFLTTLPCASALSSPSSRKVYLARVTAKIGDIYMTSRLRLCGEWTYPVFIAVFWQCCKPCTRVPYGYTTTPHGVHGRLVETP